MNSPLFYSTAYQEIQQKVLTLINTYPDFLSPNTAFSPRAVGDAIENILADSFDFILGDWSSEYSASFARRAMAALAFKDKSGFYYVVDVKTHCTDTKFNMPNLTSVERLTRFYEDDTNYFILLMVHYHVSNTKVNVTDVKFVPIEFLDWSCLTIGALGWGQIQIANANQITISANYSRKKWMLELCDSLLEFYPKEIAKIGEKIEHFQKVRDFWLSRPD